MGPRRITIRVLLSSPDSMRALLGGGGLEIKFQNPLST